MTSVIHPFFVVDAILLFSLQYYWRCKEGIFCWRLSVCLSEQCYSKGCEWTWMKFSGYPDNGTGDNWWKFHKNPCVTLWVVVLTDWQTDKPTLVKGSNALPWQRPALSECISSYFFNAHMKMTSVILWGSYTPTQWGNYHHSMFHNPTAAVNLFHIGKQYLTFCKAKAAVTRNLIGRKIISSVKRSDTRNSLTTVAFVTVD